MNIIIWGAGTDGHRLFDILQFDHNVRGFIESNPDVQGKEALGVPIFSPQEGLSQDFDYVIVANAYGEEIIPLLEKEYGVPSDKILDFIAQPMALYHTFFGKVPDSRLDTLAAIMRIIRMRNLPGATAELGVYKGDFAAYINRAFPDRKLYLFDTFSGFDARDVDRDAENAFSRSQERDYFHADIDLILQKMRRPERCVIKKGYFPESLDGLEDRFCFVSLDADLYAPILSGLAYFYPRLTQGGYILVHDYNNPKFPGASAAVHEYCMANDAPFIPLECCGSALVLK